MNLGVLSLCSVGEICTTWGFFLPYKLWSSGLSNCTPSADSPCHLHPATTTEWSTKITPSLKLNQSRWRVSGAITAFQPAMCAHGDKSWKSLLLVLSFIAELQRVGQSDPWLETHLNKKSFPSLPSLPLCIMHKALKFHYAFALLFFFKSYSAFLTVLVQVSITIVLRICFSKLSVTLLPH